MLIGSRCYSLVKFVCKIVINSPSAGFCVQQALIDRQGALVETDKCHILNAAEHLGATLTKAGYKFVGDGIVPWKDVLTLAKQQKFEGYYIEDESPDAATQIVSSLKFLKSLQIG